MTRSTAAVIPTATIATPDGPVRLHRAPKCAWCEALLVDAQGQPCWEIFDGDLTFVCREGCRPRRLPGMQWIGRAS